MRTGIFVLGIIILGIGITIAFINIPSNNSTTFTISQYSSPYGSYFTSSVINVSINEKIVLSWLSNVNLTVGIVYYTTWQSFNNSGNAGSINDSSLIYKYGYSGLLTFVSNNSNQYIIYVYSSPTTAHSKINASFKLKFITEKSLLYIGIPVVTGGVLAFIFGLVTSSNDLPKLSYGKTDNINHVPISYDKIDPAQPYIKSIYTEQYKSKKTNPPRIISDSHTAVKKNSASSTIKILRVTIACDQCGFNYDSKLMACPRCGKKREFKE